MITLFFVLSVISSYFITKVLINILTNFKILDEPDSLRKYHKQTTPRGGGLALVVVLIILGSIAEFYTTGTLNLSAKFIPLLSLISFISFLDDIKPSPIIVRLVIYLLSAGLSIYFFLLPIHLFQNYLPAKLDLLLTVICFTTFINIYNFLDGIDGLTTCESIHLSLTILILCYLKSTVIINVEMVCIIATIILGFSLSFLLFNWPPAKIFLGDVGSISLGFTLGFCLVLISASETRLFISCIIASLYYLCDGGLTIVIRLINREKIWQPHSKHFFQKAASKGKNTKDILKKIITCNFCLMLLAILALLKPMIAIILSCMTVTITLFYLVR